MENLSLMSILIIFGIIGMVVFIAIWFYLEWTCRKIISELKYLEQYEAIQYYIDHWPVTNESYNAIFAELKRLGRMKYKNREKTETLTTQFFRKFAEVRDLEY